MKRRLRIAARAVRHRRAAIAASNRRDSLSRERRAMVYRCVGVLFVLLVATPFTDPFSICDVMELAGNSSPGTATSSDDKTPSVAIALGAIDASTSIVLADAPSIPSATRLIPTSVSPHTLVLRL